MLLAQDLYVLLKVCCFKGGWTFRTLSEQLFLSVSQIHSGLKRAEAAGLFSTERRKPTRAALDEFIVHGVRYAYAVQPGPLTIGMPTSYAAPPLSSIIVASGAPPPVWPFPEGETKGYAIEPLHPAAPKAALLDKNFYELLCLVDAIREGRARERSLAEKEIHARLRN
jgi:hypothetical protein